MKLRKRLATLLITTMIVSNMSVLTFGASTNSILREVLIVKEGTSFTEFTTAQAIRIKFMDISQKEEIFYLKLTNAQWNDETRLRTIQTLSNPKQQVVDKNTEYKLYNTFYNTDGTSSGQKVINSIDDITAEIGTLTFLEDNRLQIKFNKDIIPNDSTLIFPLLVTATGGDAKVKIEKGNVTSTVTEGEFVFATTGETSLNIQVENMPSIYESGELATIVMTESFKGCLRGDKIEVNLELLNEGFIFNEKSNIEVDMLYGFQGKEISVDTYIESEGKKLKILIESNEDFGGNDSLGRMKLKGVRVKSNGNQCLEENLNIKFNIEGYNSVNYASEILTVAQIKNEEIIQFPDEKFKQALIDEGIDVNGDGNITIKEMNQVVSLSIEGKGITDITGLEYAVNLKYLYIYFEELDNISALKSLKNLQRLDIRNCKVVNLDDISELIQLKSLDITGTEVDNLQFVKRLSELENLSAQECGLKNIDGIEKLNQLKSLYLGHNPLESIEPLKYLKELEGLSLPEMEMVDISLLAQMKNLNNLDIYKSKLINIQMMKELTQLKTLDLSYCQIDDTKWLKKLDNLRLLMLFDCGISDISDICELNQLVNLNLSGNPLENIDKLSNLKNLIYLDMYNCNIENLDFVSELHSLEMLDVGNNKLKDINGLSNLVNLSVLNLSRCGLANIDALSNLRGLKHLYLSNNELTDITSIPENKYSQLFLDRNYLDISENSMTKNKIDRLIELGGEVNYTPQLEIIKSNNADLYDLRISHGILSPVFDMHTTNYSVIVDNEIKNIMIDAFPEDKNAVVIGTGEKVLNVGENRFDIIVTAENGKNTRIYTVVVKRASNPSSEGSDNNSGSNSSSGGSGSNSNTSKLETTEQVIDKLSIKDKSDIINNIKEYMPYTSLSSKLTLEQLKKFTNNKFTDKQLQEILDKSELMERLGIEKSMLSEHIVLKPVDDIIFTDVTETHWAYSSINSAVKLGLVVGMPDGTFEPSNPLQIADTFTFLDRVLLLNDVTEMKLPKSIVEKYITDKEHWAFYNMASIGSKLSEETLIAITKLKDDMISRELLAQVLYEITKDDIKVIKEAIEFEDIQQSPYQKAITYCIQTGLLNGVSHNKMEPKKALTRAELITVLIRLNEALKSELKK